jgi:hypothetical protein
LVYKRESCFFSQPQGLRIFSHRFGAPLSITCGVLIRNGVDPRYKDAAYGRHRDLAATEGKVGSTVIFLTSKEEEMDELIGLKMGADHYIRKPFSARLLVESVKVLLRRAALHAAVTNGSKIVERGELKLDSQRHSCTWKNEPVTLTVSEFFILEALANRPG